MKNKTKQYQQCRNTVFTTNLNGLIHEPMFLLFQALEWFIWARIAAECSEITLFGYDVLKYTADNAVRYAAHSPLPEVMKKTSSKKKMFYTAEYIVPKLECGKQLLLKNIR